LYFEDKTSKAEDESKAAFCDKNILKGCLVFVLGPAASKLAAAMLRRSQVCSALRGLRPLGLACGHGCAALGRSTIFFLWAFCLRHLNSGGF